MPPALQTEAHHAVMRGGPLRLLAGTRDRDAAAQIGDKGAIVEMSVRPRDGGGAGHPYAFRGSCDSTSRAQ